MTWHEHALCKDDPNYARWYSGTWSDMLDCQDVCALCPVRNGCGKEALEQEGTLGADQRWGFRAYMTPAQRSTISRLGGLRGRDPMKVVLGMPAPRRPGRPRKSTVPPIPVEGIEWTRAKAALSRKLVRWLAEQGPWGEGDFLPADDELCEMLGCSNERLHLVLDSLLQDGTLTETAPAWLRPTRSEVTT